MSTGSQGKGHSPWMGTDECKHHLVPPCVPQDCQGVLALTEVGEDKGFGEEGESQELSVTGDFMAVAKVRHTPAPSFAVTAEAQLTAALSICIS